MTATISEEKRRKLYEQITKPMLKYAHKKDEMMGKLHTAYNNLCRLGMRGEVSKKIEQYKMEINSIDYRKESYEDGLNQLKELENRILEDIPEFYNQTYFK
jgi:hypothetical protein